MEGRQPASLTAEAPTRHIEIPLEWCSQKTAHRYRFALTLWRSGIDSNSRSRWLSGEGADFRDFPFSAWETDKGQRRSAVPEKDRLPAAKRAMCVSAQRRSGQAPVL